MLRADLGRMWMTLRPIRIVTVREKRCRGYVINCTSVKQVGRQNSSSSENGTKSTLQVFEEAFDSRSKVWCGVGLCTRGTELQSAPGRSDVTSVVAVYEEQYHACSNREARVYWRAEWNLKKPDNTSGIEYC